VGSRVHRHTTWIGPQTVGGTHCSDGDDRVAVRVEHRDAVAEGVRDVSAVRGRVERHACGTGTHGDGRDEDVLAGIDHRDGVAAGDVSAVHGRVERHTDGTEPHADRSRNGVVPGVDHRDGVAAGDVGAVRGRVERHILGVETDGDSGEGVGAKPVAQQAQGNPGHRDGGEYHQAPQGT